MRITSEQLEIWNRSPKILAGTGHRPHKLNKEYDLKGECSSFLREKMLEYFRILTPRKIISGMAVGFDQLLALVALEQNIKVVAALPCDNQEARWPAASQVVYHSILKNPLVTIKEVSPGPYHISKMSIRNEWMVNNSDALLAVWDGSSGGTANCVRFGQKNKKFIIQINPQDYLTVSEDN